MRYDVAPARLGAGTYRTITGNLALAYGLIAGSVSTGLPLFLGSYPTPPASDILHELSRHKRFGVTSFQAEDEKAGIGAALGVMTTSGLGLALKERDLGLGGHGVPWPWSVRASTVDVDLPSNLCELSSERPPWLRLPPPRRLPALTTRLPP